MGSTDYSNEPLGHKKGEKFLDHSTDYQLLKNASASWVGVFLFYNKLSRSAPKTNATKRKNCNSYHHMNLLTLLLQY
jgi:hypothetical protein